MQTTAQQQYHASRSSNGGAGGGGAGGSGGQVTTNGTVNPALVASASTASNNNPRLFSPDEDYNLARVVLDQLKKHPGYEEVRWDKVEKKLKAYGRREGNWEERWDGLRKEVDDAVKSLEVAPYVGAGDDEEAWTPADDALLLAAAEHFTSHHPNPPAALAALQQAPSSSIAASVAWIVTRERTRLGNSFMVQENSLVTRSLASCHARYLAFRNKVDSVRNAYAAPHAIGELGGVWTKEQAQLLVGKMLEVQADLRTVDGGWEERERVGKWETVKGEGFIQRSVLDLMSKWNELRVGLLSNQLEEAMPDPDVKPKPMKRTSTSSSSERKKRIKKEASPSSPEHAHEPWTSAADADLRRLHAEGNNWSTIAHELGRTKGSVTSRWQMYREQWKEKGLLPSPSTLFAGTPSPSTHNGDILVNSPSGEGEEAVDELDEGQQGDEEEEEESGDE